MASISAFVFSSQVVAPRSASSLTGRTLPGASDLRRPVGRVPRRVERPHLVGRERRATRPGASRASLIGPMRVRTSRRTGWPTASHMRRTWRLRPSWIASSSAAPRAVRRTTRHARRRCAPVVELDAFAQRAQRAAAGTPSTSARYVFVDAVARDGVSSCGEVAVVREDQQPLGVVVEPSDREHAGLAGHQLDHGRPALRVARGGHDAGRLVQQVVDEIGQDRHRHAVELDVIASPGRPAAQARDVAVDGAPGPAAISSSHARREPEPGAGEHLLEALAVVGPRSGVGTGSLGELHDRVAVGAGPVVVEIDRRRFGLVGDAQPALERLDDAGLGHEVAEWRQVGE